MDIGDKEIWKVAAGYGNRNYARTLLKWDVVAVGPGERGKYPECVNALVDDGYEQRGIDDLRRFYEEIEVEDIIVLKFGTTYVYGVGEVVGPPEWSDDFGDIDGWTLQHIRRVRWLWKCNDQPKSFAGGPLGRGGTVRRMRAEPVLKWLEGLEIPAAAHQRQLRPIPTGRMDPEGRLEKHLISTREISSYLFDQGIAADSVDNLMNQMEELVRIAGWYRRSEEDPSEHETTSYLVVPLLRSLGWTPQRMAVEWKGLDLALFLYLPREDRNMAVAVEVKKMSDSCLSAKSQAEDYATKGGRDNCRRLIVTDGLRYGVYLRASDGSFGDIPAAYLNLTRLVSDYPILECKGAKEALLLMAPDWNEGMWSR